LVREIAPFLHGLILCLLLNPQFLSKKINNRRDFSAIV
jgi:hypothetical protein